MSRDELPSHKEAEILRLLIARGESYGLDLVKASNGTLKRGTIYVTLSRMKDKGFVEDREEIPPPKDYIGITRRLYKATGLGERALRALDHVPTMLAKPVLV